MTPIDPFELWNDFRSWVNTQQGGFMPPQNIFMRVANVASLELWKELTAIAEKSQEIKDNLFPFLVSKNIITTQANSFYSVATPPPNYGRFATAKILLHKEKEETVPDKCVDKGRCQKGNKVNVKLKTDEELTEEYYDNVIEAQVQMVDNQKWSAMLKHLTKFPTFKNPKCTQINGIIQVAPRTVSVIVLNYYVEPIDAVFAYTPTPGNPQTGSGGSINYDLNNSTPFQWSKTVKVDLLEMIKKVYIGFTRDGLYQQIKSAQKGGK